jgi:hypothetical protein
MGFLTNVLSATIKTALTPIAVAKDVINVATGEEVESTKSLLESAKDDVEEGFEDIGDGKFL